MTLAVVATVVVALLLLPLPVEGAMRRWPALTQELENLGHPLAFGLLAYLGFRLLRRHYLAPSRKPYVLVMGGAVILGLATEALQCVVGRDSSWIDLINDVFGAGFTMLLCARAEAWRESHSPGTGRAWLAAATVVALLATGPFLWTATAYIHRTLHMPVLWRADSALFARFSRWQDGEYPGLNIEEPSADWSGYQSLAVAVRNLGDEPLQVVVRVHDIPHEMSHDQRHGDRFNKTLELPPGAAQTLRIPLEEIRHAPQGRSMDMQAISGVVIFQVGGQSHHFGVTQIRLD